MRNFTEIGGRWAVIGLSGIMVALSAATARSADVLDEISVEERMFLPAVSGVNGKLETAYTHFNLEEGDGKGYLLQGAVSLPVGQRFGFQFDAGTLNGDLDSDEILAQGIGGHFFWRDPSTALLGFYGHHVRYGDDIDVTRLGAELEWYNGQFSFEGFAGVDRLDTPIGNEDFLAGEAVIAWYASDNFRLSAGIQHSFEQTSAIAGLELMLDGADFAPAIFANAAIGDDETMLMAGVRLYLGQSKSLKARHRQDDPAIGLFDQFGGVSNCIDDVGKRKRVTQIVPVTLDNQRPTSNSNHLQRVAPSPPQPSPIATATTHYSLDGCSVRSKTRIKRAPVPRNS